jgi:membrane-bound inhibitor of C-type lysozyme
VGKLEEYQQLVRAAQRREAKKKVEVLAVARAGFAGLAQTLPQLISGSGVRYGNEDESFVFWNKGDTAVITEGPQKQETFSNCEVEVPGQEPRSTYASSTMGISIKYPKSSTLGVTYQYTGFPKKPIVGVKILIPDTMATGTNLASADTGVSVEQLPRAKNCTADIFINANVKAVSLVDDGVAYSVASSTDAAVGNRYEEIVYALSGTKPCTAVRYYLHYMAIENFAPGVAREFDRAAVLAGFDAIRSSLRISATSTGLTP